MSKVVRCVLLCAVSLSLVGGTLHESPLNEHVLTENLVSHDGRHIRYVTDDHSRNDHRELGSFSWVNLLFKVGVCHKPSSTCPDYSSDHCPCPDCSKKLIPPHLHSYCLMVQYRSNGGSSSSNSGSSSGSGSSSSEGGDSNGYGESAAEVWETFDTSDNYNADRGGDMTSTGSRIFKPWMLFVALSATLAAAVGSIYIRSRNLQKEDGAAEQDMGYNIMAGLGLQPPVSAEDDMKEHPLTVAQRISMLCGNGVADGPVDEDMDTEIRRRPSFVHVPSRLPQGDGLMTESMLASPDRGNDVEVEGPFRPSTYSASYEAL